MVTAAAATLMSAVIGDSGPLERHAFTSEHMGTTFRVVVYADDGRTAADAAREAFARVALLDSLLSDWRDDSEIADLARRAGDGSSVPVSAELWEVLAESLRWAEASDGAFDPTVGPLSRLWRWSARRGELPAGARRAAAIRLVGSEHLTLDGATRSVALRRAGMSLDLGGIAKGYAADAALAVLRAHGIDAALVDAGGDVALGDPPPGEPGWRIALPGGRTARLARAAVATSGDEHRWVEVDGVRYSHVVDPRTGLGVVDAPTVTVVAPTAAAADALASALTVMDAESGRLLAGSLDGVWTRVTRVDGAGAADGAGGWESGVVSDRMTFEERRNPS